MYIFVAQESKPHLPLVHVRAMATKKKLDELKNTAECNKLVDARTAALRAWWAARKQLQSTENKLLIAEVEKAETLKKLLRHYVDTVVAVPRDNMKAAEKAYRQAQEEAEKKDCISEIEYALQIENRGKSQANIQLEAQEALDFIENFAPAYLPDDVAKKHDDSYLGRLINGFIFPRTLIGTAIAPTPVSMAIKDEHKVIGEFIAQTGSVARSYYLYETLQDAILWWYGLQGTVAGKSVPVVANERVKFAKTLFDTDVLNHAVVTKYLVKELLIQQRQTRADREKLTAEQAAKEAAEQAAKRAAEQAHKPHTSNEDDNVYFGGGALRVQPARKSRTRKSRTRNSRARNSPSVAVASWARPSHGRPQGSRRGRDFKRRMYFRRRSRKS